MKEKPDARKGAGLHSGPCCGYRAASALTGVSQPCVSG